MKSGDQQGFVERWLRRCGERPGRMFLLLWGALLLVSVLVSLFGLRHERFNAVPPDPRSIPYVDWLPGGLRSEEGVLTLRPEELPEYDGSHATNQIGIIMEQRTEKEGGPRLVAWRARYIGSVGWPWTSCVWSSQTSWDVMDPAKPFEPIADHCRLGRAFGIGHYSIDYGWCSRDGTIGSNISIPLPGGLLHFAVPQILAGLIVGMTFIVHRVRLLRRRRLRRCADCGQQLDPGRPLTRCPECGSTAANSKPLANSFRIGAMLGGPVRLAAALFLMVAVIWLIGQRQVWSRNEWELDRRLAEKAVASNEQNRRFRSRVIARFASYGWPMPVLGVQDDHWFSFAPQEKPERVAAETVAGGWIGFDWGRESIMWSTHSDDPSITRLYSLNWALAVMQLSLLQIGTAVVGGLLCFSVRFARRRLASSRSPQGES